MSESSSGAGGGGSAGTLLRLAREKQGLHVAALAAAIKIPQRKLEALEADRFEELPDATFTRALAMTVCRALKIDPAPVLSQLPQGGPQGLGKVNGSLNTPFRERPGRSGEAADRRSLSPLAWAALLVVVVAVGLYLSPAAWWEAWFPASGNNATTETVVVVPEPAGLAASAPQPEAAASAADAAASVAAAETAPQIEVAASAAVEADVAKGLAVLTASDSSWVEVIDAEGRVLVQRVLRPNESLSLDGRLPFKLKIGNAAATQLQFRGQVVDLASVTRDNVARLELK